MDYTAFYSVSLLPGGVIFGALLLLMVVPILAVAVVFLVLLATIALLVALVGTIAASPVLIVRAARRRRAVHDSAAQGIGLSGSRESGSSSLVAVGEGSAGLL